MRSYWRDICSPIIYQVIRENKNMPIPELKKKISQAYPFGEREQHPYKIWLDEVKKQLASLQKLKEWGRK